MKIEFVSPENEINPENDNVDVIVHFDDGSSHSLLVATPNNIYWCMDNEGLDHYFGVPPREAAVAALLQDPGVLSRYYASQATSDS